MPSRGRLHPLPLSQHGPYGPHTEPCAEPGCITIPNSYNPGPYCLLHTEATEPTDRERSRQLDLEARRERRLAESIQARAQKRPYAAAGSVG